VNLIARRAWFCLWCPAFSAATTVVLPIGVAVTMFAGTLIEAVSDVPRFWRRHWPR
jgi:hypothetical protein